MRLLRYFRSLHPERSYAGILDHALICGGLASLNGLAEYLKSTLELRVEPARPLTGLVGKFDRESFHLITRRQEAYTVVIGLALSGLANTKTTQGETDGGREFAWTRAA
jgi:Tfp pilus assembly PilM family ATPase